MYVMRKILLNTYGSQINFYLHQKHQNGKQTILIHSHTFCHIHIQSLKFSLLRTRAVTPFALSNLVQIQDYPFLIFLKTLIGPLIYGVVHTVTNGTRPGYFQIVDASQRKAKRNTIRKKVSRQHTLKRTSAHCAIPRRVSGADRMMKDQ
ncbi:Hypothetical_protein [Hexamita inflata]|uniref:Hypothetical_protein n=1 Tax=Hexamita inflata TaxID=28002 RepID=A0AA86QUR4_9EUKA|nr:Hypothetical protein HINF_LOCUS52183 [Hexamita inflata]